MTTYIFNVINHHEHILNCQIKTDLIILKLLFKTFEISNYNLDIIINMDTLVIELFYIKVSMQNILFS